MLTTRIEFFRKSRKTTCCACNRIENMNITYILSFLFFAGVHISCTTKIYLLVLFSCVLSFFKFCSFQFLLYYIIV